MLNKYQEKYRKSKRELSQDRSFTNKQQTPYITDQQPYKDQRSDPIRDSATNLETESDEGTYVNRSYVDGTATTTIFGAAGNNYKSGKMPFEFIEHNSVPTEYTRDNQMI